MRSGMAKCTCRMRGQKGRAHIVLYHPCNKGVRTWEAATGGLKWQLVQAHAGRGPESQRSRQVTTVHPTWSGMAVNVHSGHPHPTASCSLDTVLFSFIQRAESSAHEAPSSEHRGTGGDSCPRRASSVEAEQQRKLCLFLCVLGPGMGGPANVC